MTDYNDGNWHGWDGGECPVHPESMIAVKWVTRDGCLAANDGRIARINNWKTPCLFRVTKPYAEPREFWINEYPGCFGTPYSSKAEADEGGGGIRIRCIHVREVIGEREVMRDAQVT